MTEKKWLLTMTMGNGNLLVPVGIFTTSENCKFAVDTLHAMDPDAVTTEIIPWHEIENGYYEGFYYWGEGVSVYYIARELEVDHMPSLSDIEDFTV